MPSIVYRIPYLCIWLYAVWMQIDAEERKRYIFIRICMGFDQSECENVCAGAGDAVRAASDRITDKISQPCTCLIHSLSVVWILIWIFCRLEFIQLHRYVIQWHSECSAHFTSFASVSTSSAPSSSTRLSKLIKTFVHYVWRDGET